VICLNILPRDFSFVSGLRWKGKVPAVQNFPLATSVTDHWGDGGKRKVVNSSSLGNCIRGLALCDLRLLKARYLRLSTKFRGGTDGSIFLALMTEDSATISPREDRGSKNELLKLGIIPVAVGTLTVFLSHARHCTSSLHIAMLVVLM
jgi:hypothetical protein